MTLSVLARAGVLDEALVDEAGSLSYAEPTWTAWWI